MKKLMNGELVDLTPEEVAAVQAEWAAAESERIAGERVRLVSHYDGIVQARLDAVARSFGYGDPNRPEVSPILHAISYADEPAVPAYQQEGQSLRAWRSLTWAKAAQILAAVDAGTRTVPTESELLAELEAAAPAPVPV